MQRPLPCLLVLVLALAGCTTAPTTATRLEPKIQAKIQRGVVEPGFTPEMVYLALGKPSEPDQSLADATTNGTWIYRDFQQTNGEFLKAGYRQHVVADPDGKKQKIVTEPVDPQRLPTLTKNAVHITFRDGRVVEIQRT